MNLSKPNTREIGVITISGVGVLNVFEREEINPTNRIIPQAE